VASLGVAGACAAAAAGAVAKGVAGACAVSRVAALLSASARRCLPLAANERTAGTRAGVAPAAWPPPSLSSYPPASAPAAVAQHAAACGGQHADARRVLHAARRTNVCVRKERPAGRTARVRRVLRLRKHPPLAAVREAEQPDGAARLRIARRLLDPRRRRRWLQWAPAMAPALSRADHARTHAASRTATASAARPVGARAPPPCACRRRLAA
jgi:hypothetical protein